MVRLTSLLVGVVLLVSSSICFATTEDDHGDSVVCHPSSGEHAGHKDGGDEHDDRGDGGDDHSEHEDDDLFVAVSILGAAGTSTVDDDELAELQGGGHDPKRSGLNLQQIELAVDGRLGRNARGALHLVQGEEELELEEAYVEFASPEKGARARLGYLLAPFGLLNQRHPHSWQWIDQPIIATRLLGSEGSRSLGIRGDIAFDERRGTWLSAAVLRADDDTMISFRGTGHVHGPDGHGHGTHALRSLARRVSQDDHDDDDDHHDDDDDDHHDDDDDHHDDDDDHHDDDDDHHDDDDDHHDDDHHGHDDELVERIEELFGGTTVGLRPRQVESGGAVLAARLSHEWGDECSRYQLGASAMYGPNAAGEGNRTRIWGADFSYHWQPCVESWPFVLLEGEYMQRSFSAPSVFDDGEPDAIIDLPADTLRDSGWYAQGLYGFASRWAGGIRYERASSSGESVGGSDVDPLREDRTRVSPLLAYYPDDRTRLRVQWNRDQSQHIGSASTFWFGADVTLGKHRHSGAPGFEAPGHGDHSGHDHGDDAGHDHGDHAGHDHGDPADDHTGHGHADNAEDHAGHDHAEVHTGHDHVDHAGHDHGGPADDHAGHDHGAHDHDHDQDDHAGHDHD